MLVVGVVAGVIFFPSLILRGPYFTLVSIAFAESIRQFIINSEFFGRASGVGLPFGKDSFAQFRFTSKVPYYYIGFIMMVGGLPHHEEDRPLQAGLCAAHHPRG